MKLPHIRKNKAIINYRNSVESCQYMFFLLKNPQGIFLLHSIIKLKQQSHFYKSINDMSCFPCSSFIRATLSQSARIPPWTGWPSTCPRSGGNGPPTLSSPSRPTSDISNRGRIYRRWKTSSQDLHRSNITTVDSLLHSRF